MSSEPISRTTIEHDSLLLNLHSKSLTSRTLPVRIHLEDSVGAPYQEDGVWAVPCDIVGLYSKKPKMVKVRFHSSLPTHCDNDVGLIEVALKQALDYLEVLVSDTEWAVKSELELHKESLRNFSKFLLHQHCYVASGESLSLSWPLLSDDSLKKKTRQLVDEGSKAICPSLLKNVVVNVKTKGNRDRHLSDISLEYKTPELSVDLMEVALSQPSLKAGTYTEAIQLSKEGMHVILPVSGNSQKSEGAAPVVEEANVFVDGVKMPKMLDASQLRVDALRRRLDESLADFQKACSNRGDHTRSLHIIMTGQNEAVIEIGKNGARSTLDRLVTATQPLKVVCDGGSSRDLSNSPTDSIDSGVSEMSPTASPVAGKHSPFYKYSLESRLGMRQRSASECDWGTHDAGLKSILKKSSVERFGRFSRSISECHPHPDDDAPFTLMRTATLEEDDEEEEDHSDHLNSDPELSPRKKRVSFSEKLIQMRRFKSGQSIASQAKKNEKKRECRRRKEERERGISQENLSGETETENETGHSILKVRTTVRVDSGFVDDDDEVLSEPFSPDCKSEKNLESEWINHMQRIRKVAQH